LIVGSLTAELAPAAVKREQAERLLAEAIRAEYGLVVAARWVKATADFHAFVNPPAPSGEEIPPPGWSGRVAPDDLARHWSERQPWNDLYEPPEELRSWQDSDSDGDAPEEEAA
jgi:hypothetical protein